MVDVAPADVGWAAQCAGELVVGDGEDQVVLRGERRLAGRLVRGDALDSDDSEPDGTRPDSGEAPAVEWRTPPQPFRLTPARPGFWDGLEHRPLRRRAPAAGEIEIEVTAAALNFIDVMKAMGTYPDPSGGAALLGGECAGRVSAVGSGRLGRRPRGRAAAGDAHRLVRAVRPGPARPGRDRADPLRGRRAGARGRRGRPDAGRAGPGHGRQ
ncbi:alcohol dehydrogenase catalytic domain-containing protein [Frankia sp. CcWB3]